LFHGAVGVPGVARKYELIVIALAASTLAMFSLATTQSCMLSRMTFALRLSLSPTSIQMRSGLAGVWDEVFMEFPCAVGCLGVRRPLLVYVSA